MSHERLPLMMDDLHKIKIMGSTINLSIKSFLLVEFSRDFKTVFAVPYSLTDHSVITLLITFVEIQPNSSSAG